MRAAAACSSVLKPTGVSDGPFFRGPIADLQVDVFLTAGHRSNCRPEVVMNHVYFTALADGAGLAAEIAAGLSGTDAAPHVYAIEPIGIFGNEPDVTDKKFPGNPTRSYRTSAPLRITGEIVNWTSARRYKCAALFTHEQVDPFAADICPETLRSRVGQ